MAKKCESNDICSGMLDLLVSRGVVEDKRIVNPKVRLDKQKRNQMAYHNTELLLKHYRDIVWLLECFPDTIAEELEEPMKNVDELIDKLDLEMAKGNRRVENRMKSLEATRLMLDRINDALTVLKKKPRDGEMLYELIRLTYIDQEKLTHTRRLRQISRRYTERRRLNLPKMSLKNLNKPGRCIRARLTYGREISNTLLSCLTTAARFVRLCTRQMR